MTPIRRQYLRIKKRYPDAIVLFRMGDFYETFDEDAKIASRELEIALTSKPLGKGLRVPLAGIPYHALESYLAKLIQRGYKVAICEQLGDPATSKGLLEREVVRVVTPGTVLEPSLLHAKANNYLAALLPGPKEAGVAYLDITTMEFATTQLLRERVSLELERLRPVELLVPQGLELPVLPEGLRLTPLEPEVFGEGTARHELLGHFGVSSLEAYGCEHLPLAVGAAGAILSYLQQTQRAALGSIDRLSTYSTESFMPLDAQTCRNLELLRSLRHGEIKGSLLSVLDQTKTPMGGRLLKRWLTQPLVELAPLLQRQQQVKALFEAGMARAQVRDLLDRCSDLERLTARIAHGIATPREVATLGRTVALVAPLRELLPQIAQAEALAPLREQLCPCQEIAALIAQALVEEPPATVGEVGAMRRGFSPELDSLRLAARNAQTYLAGLEQRERERTGMRSLKVGYNKVFGYYIEVSRSHLKQVPPDYQRKQTLVGGERFITVELKEYETIILNAQERSQELEAALFRSLCRQISEARGELLRTAAAMAQLDVLAALAEVATQNGYVAPELTEDDSIVIREGRHPVVEQTLQEEPFVPNDTELANREAQIIVLTGPNMAGKSTYLRQVALIVLLAQIGSFVPAREARMGLVDRIFTRVGAQEDLAAGQSTFMVEMLETAYILHHATPRSLIILDEIGRGTSTYDGMAIARAVVEHLHHHPRLGAKTLFATHYHELTELASHLPRVRNYTMAVAEERGRVIFLRKVVPGGADRSYGVHVARLAGLPRAVVDRAAAVLEDLERGDGLVPRLRGKPRPQALQLSFLPEASPLLEELRRLDLSSMTPLQALNTLYELQQRAQAD